MSSRSWLRFAVVLICALVFQVTVLDQIVILGAHPDVMVLIPAAAGLVAGPERGAVVGFVTGLVADLVVSLPFGLSALTFTLVGFGVGLLGMIPASRNDASARFGCCVAAAALGTALYALFAALVNQSGVLGSTAAAAVLVVTLGALVLAYPVIAILGWVLADTSAASYVPSGGSALS